LDLSRNSSILPNFRFSILRYARKFLPFTVWYCLKSCLPSSETVPKTQVLRREPVVRMKCLLPQLNMSNWGAFSIFGSCTASRFRIQIEFVFQREGEHLS
jgi:hypothetical protein